MCDRKMSSSKRVLDLSLSFIQYVVSLLTISWIYMFVMFLEICDIFIKVFKILNLNLYFLALSEILTIFLLFFMPMSESILTLPVRRGRRGGGEMTLPEVR